MCININDLSDKITPSILNSSDKYIPPLERSKENKPWTDEHFLRLIENRNKAKKVEEKRTLDKEVKKYRDKLKNDYFSKKADALNTASEARDVEEQFRLAKNHSMLEKSKKLVIAPEKLTSHFKEHFSPRPVVIQPEVENPLFLPIFSLQDHLLSRR